MTSPLDRQTLVIPPGVEIRVDSEGISVEHEGDIELLGPQRWNLHQLISRTGSVQLRSTEPITVHRIEAPGGEITLSGQITAHSLVARRVTFAQGHLNVKELVADEMVSLAGESLQADIIIGPVVEIHARIKGRATVIESKNEIGASLLKGGFRLAEYLEIFPTGREWLHQFPDVERRLEGWKDVGLPDRVEAAPPSAQVASSPIPIETRPPPGPAAEPTGTDRAGAEPRGTDRAGAIEAPASSGPGVGHTTAEAVGPGAEKTAAVEASRPAQAQPPAQRPDPSGQSDEPEDSEAIIEVLSHGERVDTATEELYHRMSESFGKILSCYPDVRLPPPLLTLRGLIDDRRFDVLKRQLTSLWNELLQYHKREGLHIANTVTHNIQEMKRMLQDRP